MWSMSKSKNKQQEEEEFSEKDRKSLLFDNGEGSTNNSSNNDNDDDDQDKLTPPAWNAMLQSLNIPTPYIPMSTRGNIPKRYDILRKHLPENFILLQEILQGRHDLQMTHHTNQYLCAWVETVEEQNSHHGIWTVGLKDETGARIRAWMEPNFVKEELQKTTKDASLGVVRVGVVWMISNFSMIAIQNNTSGSSNQSGTVERMLVVSGKRIQQVWTPESNRVQIQPTEDEDSPQAQQDYIDWMAKRNALTMDENLYDEPEKEERQQDEDEDDPPDNGQIVGDKEKEVRMTEMSALTMTADDEHSMIASQHDERIPSDDQSFNKDTERNFENELHNDSAPLQTQESIRIENKMTNLASQQPISQSSTVKPPKRKKEKKQRPSSPMTPTRQSPKRRRPNQSPNRNSPIRMSQSVWNTPDPSILEMLNADSDENTVDEEDEIPTVMDEEATPFTFPTQFSNKPPQSLSKPSRHDDYDDKNLFPAGRVFLGSKLFEPSSWAGMDATAFDESDSE